MLSALSPRRRAYVGALAVIALLAAVIAWSATRPGRDLAPGAEPVVVLVTGYGGDAGSVATLASALRAAGRTVEVVVPPEQNTGDIRRSAAALDRAVGDRTVDVVGYSAGGVVARWWVRFLGGAEQVRRVLTLGSPHHGTTLAAELGALAGDQCRGACAQLQPGSSLLRDLNAGDETPQGPEWTAVWTANDETVVPPESGRLDGATNVRVQDVCAGRRISHSGLVRDRGAVALAVAVLAGQPPRC